MMEFDGEPVRGLPEALPDGEDMLWQGAPSMASIARRVFHVRFVAGYFGVIALWRFGATLSDGAPLVSALSAATAVLVVGAGALALLFGLAALTARTSVYTLTTKRLVLRIGIALPKAINIPFRIIGSADVRTHADGSGDISLKLTGADQIAYIHLWPHVRPWTFNPAQPTLRSVPDASAVAQRLAHAVRAAAPEANLVARPGAAIADPAASDAPSRPISPAAA